MPLLPPALRPRALASVVVSRCRAQPPPSSAAYTPQQLVQLVTVYKRLAVRHTLLQVRRGWLCTQWAVDCAHNGWLGGGSGWAGDFDERVVHVGGGEVCLCAP